jgi:hypothetical protein
MSDDRSERLRQRRNQSQERPQQSDSSDVDSPSEPDNSSEQSEPSEPSKPSKLDESTPDDTDSSVKEEQVGTYMYLPKSQKKELERLYNVLKAEYEYEYDEEFEKNRQFYPLVVQYGFESLDGLDASEKRERLETI